MRFDKLTVKAQEAIQEAESLAHRYNHSAIEPDHILMSLLEQQDGVVNPLLDRVGAPSRELACPLKLSALRRSCAGAPLRRKDGTTSIFGVMSALPAKDSRRHLLRWVTLAAQLL